MAGLRRRRPLPDRQPVLPHVRVQGRAASRRSCAARRSIPKPVFDVDDVLRTRRPRSGHRAARARRRCTSRSSTIPTATATTSRACGVAVTGAADIPVELIRRDARGAAVPADRHRLRAHRGGHGHRPPRPTTTSRPSPPPSVVPRPGFEVRIVDDDGRRRAGRASRARSLVRGDSVMRGYLDDPDATAAAIDADGWLHTGDLGTIDERRLPAHRRADQGHVHRRRVQRLPGRDREPAAAPPAPSRRPR